MRDKELKRVLVYGEYSGYGKSLVDGFRENGYEAAVFSFDNDAWKNISIDISLPNVNWFFKLYYLIKLLPELGQYDVVYIMNPQFLSLKRIGPIVATYFKWKNIEINLLCCGDDCEYIKLETDSNFEGWVYKNISLPRTNYFKRWIDWAVNNQIASISKSIIPTMYDYSYGWRRSKFKDKVTETIPLACDYKSESISFEIKDKVKILHGINRPDVKGSKVILSALKRIKSEYSNVEILEANRLSFDKYINLLRESDIVIDQCRSNSYGMNGIFAMFCGSILLSSFSREAKEDLGINNSPVISIIEDEDVIYNKLCEVLNMKKFEMEKIKRETYDFAYSLHDSKKVAKKILDTRN
ncbi:hypothetical protein [Vibrio cyclitrophicus]|uniref:hypothetical protein n=1 Tax=Vibrio cyclitrophicus TaxID=47951 RepID=UPI0021C46D51|nr:hypothetical protein [Vibrio cyclitrophicus]